MSVAKSHAGPRVTDDDRPRTGIGVAFKDVEACEFLLRGIGHEQCDRTVDALIQPGRGGHRGREQVVAVDLDSHADELVDQRAGADARWCW
ncbi:MAG: hypothetical protein U5K73_09550 [Halofilum sp. (in: g-proteobacteria)]|nr:hypothetical protein [Halofilum sp. (in: g-proteobacteria)]